MNTNTKSAKSEAKSNHNPKSPEAAASPEARAVPAHAASGSVAGSVSVTPVTGAATHEAAAPTMSPAAPPTPTEALAPAAIAAMDAIEATLNLDIVVAPNDKRQMGAMNRVSEAAIGVAADIVSAAPQRFTDFADLPESADYVTSMAQVASRALEFAMHVQKSVMNRRAPAAVKTLALYAVVKGLGRIVDNETMREKVVELKAELTPKRKNVKPRATKDEKAAARAEKAKAKRVAKAQAVLVAAGVVAQVPERAGVAGSNGLGTATPGVGR